jgi:methionyl aminopeptidase
VFSEEEIKKLKKAGEMSGKLLLESKKKVEKGEIKSDLQLVNFIDEQIEKLKEKEENLKKAFPVNISVNEIAAHYTPFDKEYFFKEDDIIKIDLGISIDGYIADNALTVYLGKNEEKLKLVKASKKALEEVKKNIKKGIKNGELGILIEKTIKSLGFNPVYNLGGHSIERYNLHSGLFIPNYDSKENKELKEGVYAVEPFATNGVGYVKDYSFSNIVKLEPLRVRIPLNLKKYYNILFKEFKTLPFSLLDIKKILNVDNEQVKHIIALLEKFRVLYKYPILIEKSKGLVSQHEHTFLILEDEVIVTTEIWEE